MNSLKEASQPPIPTELHADGAVPEATSSALGNPDLLLFTDCGVRCMDLARIYYIDDFDVFKYAQTLNDPTDRRRL